MSQASVALQRTVSLVVDGLPVTVEAGSTLLEAAAAAGIKIPTLCHHEWVGATGTCMVCVVEVDGVGLVPACSSPAADGLMIATASEAVVAARRRAVEAILADHYADCVAPCTLACPAGVDVQNYLKLVALDLPAEAAALVREANPFPGVHGRVCTRPCEEACRRHQVDQPVAICAVKRSAADGEAESGLPPIPRVAASGRRVAIVGAGPGGLTCAFYLARMGHAITVFEGRLKPGGMLRYGIPSYRLPRQVLEREIDYILRHGVELVTGKALGRDFSLASLAEQGFEAVFLATGAHSGQRLGVPGEEMPQVLSGIDFLARLETEGRVELGPRVVVVGGGNTAVDAARSALRLGAGEVTLVYRRTRAEMPAHHEEIEDAEEEGVRLTLLATPTAVEAGPAGSLRLRLIRMKLGEPDASGRPRPEPVPGSDYEMEVDTVIAAIGQVPNASLYSSVEGLKTGRGGILVADAGSQATGLPGVFAGGDLTTGAATAVEAVGAGRRAALAIDRYLRGERELAEPRPFTLRKVDRREDALAEEFAGVERLPRQSTRRAPVAERISDFREADLGLEGGAARAEAGRCLECGCKAAHDCRLRDLAGELDVKAENFPVYRRYRAVDRSHPFIEHDPNRCIACGQCARVCQEVQGVGALAVRHRLDTLGATPGLLATRCESCGQCLSACPTGAIVAGREVRPEREIRTICVYCGVGCGVLLGVRGNAVTGVRGDPDHPVNRGLLCVKGRFGYDFIRHPDRLTTPLVRRNGELVPVSWDEALAAVADGLGRAGRVAVMGSARSPNEDMYVLQKFARVVLGTNNIDHCARLCHAPSVAGLAQAFGSGAMTNPIQDLASAACILAIGTNTTETHPVIGLEVKRAVRRGTRLIVANPLRIDLCRSADIWLQHRPGTDVALLSGLAHVILEEGLADHEYLRERCEDYEALEEALAAFDPRTVETITGVGAGRLREAARLYATSTPASIIYSMGITQHSHGTDNVFAVANLALLTGNVGLPGGGVNPLRGQNNVQGACDMAVLPNVLPGYQAVTDPAKRARFEAAYGVALPAGPGMTVSDMVEAMATGSLDALYIVGQNPMLSQPDLGRLEESLGKLGFLVVQDIFLTETAALADVVLPAACWAERDGTFVNTERRVQLIRKAVDPPGMARADWEIIAGLARRMGGIGFDWPGPQAIMEEIASLVPYYGGLSYRRLETAGVQWPCPAPDHPGTPVLHTDRFLAPSGKARCKPLTYRPSVELPDAEYPILLTTGRLLYHYHTGTGTRRVEGLNALADQERVRVNPADAGRLGIADGHPVRVTSRRGSVTALARLTGEVPEGVIFMTFHFAEACANQVTSPAVDPVSKIPSLKVCAVRLEPVDA
ncbi:MAG: formate dehydrogenase subunit alpha [bacterium]|nr:formate dehydrogenase subunit alpha [bacterium]